MEISNIVLEPIQIFNYAFMFGSFTHCHAKSKSEDLNELWVFNSMASSLGTNYEERLHS